MNSEELLARYRGWILVMARAVTYDPVRVDEVAQEGNIELWRQYRALVDEPEEQRIAWSLHRARRRMVGVAQGRSLTGHTGLPGHIPVDEVTILDTPLGEGSADTLADVMMPDDDALFGVEMAYHDGEFAAALAALDERDREYVSLRFWGGWTDSEIARETNRSTSGVNNRWTRTIRPTLLAHLGHLRSA